MWHADQMEIQGSVAVVTGAARGIGAAIASALLENGARVVMSDIDAETLSRTVEQFAANHHAQVVGVSGNAADVHHISQLISLAEQSFGPLDFYFANAGVANGDGLNAGEDEWDQAFEVNLRAHVRAAQLLVPLWLDRGRGYFVSTASAAGLLTQIGSATYATSKHAAVAFAEWLSVMYGDQGIRVSVLAPMGVETAMLEMESNIATAAVKNAGKVLSVTDVADELMRGIEAEDFLVLPHPEVLQFFSHKAQDYESWLSSMRRYRKSLEHS